MPGVIFDLDGTLIDSYEAHFKAWIKVAADIGHTLTEAQFAASFGRKNEPIIAELHEFAGRTVPDEAAVEVIAEHKETLYRGHVGAGLFPAMAGAAALIDGLKAAGWGVAIGSSAPRINVEFALDRFEPLGVTFDAVVCGCDVTRGKPEPDVFLHAADQLGLAPEDCIVFEDAAPGIEAGRRAGMVTVGIASKGRTHEELADADQVINHLNEHYVDSLGALLQRHRS